MEKILIIGSDIIDKASVAKKLIEIDDTLCIASTFTSDLSYKGMSKDNNVNNIYYNSNENINLDYKNNALLYISSNDIASYGVTLDEFYNTNITTISIKDFNTISDKILNTNDIIIVWIDSKCNLVDRSDLKETKFLMDRIDKYPYLYFIDGEDIDEISNTILEYINCSTTEEKKLFLLKNS